MQEEKKEENLLLRMVKPHSKIRGGQISHGFKLRNQPNLLKKIFYSKFTSAKSRCNNPNLKCFIRYGRKGILFSWNNFEEFKNNMWRTFIFHVKKHGLKNTTLERKKNNGNYCKKNCRWATQIEQNNNKKNNHYITYNGITDTIANWGRRIGMSEKTIETRKKSGWSVRDILVTPKCKNQFDRIIK